MEDKSKMPSWAKWIIALLIVLVFALTVPKDIKDFKNASRDARITNCFLFSICVDDFNKKEYYSNYATVHYLGILNMTFKIRVKKIGD